MKTLSLRLLGLSAVLLLGCNLPGPDFAGKSCDFATDCPPDYTCVAARSGMGRTCEVLNTPEVAEPTEPTGPVPTWCADVQPILAANCLSTCHGAVNSSSGRTDFRLDMYADNGSIKGAKSMADRIKVRAVDQKTMPLPGNPAPTADQLEILSQWVTGGAPECDSDGGTPSDGGTSIDSGTPTDGGTRTDGGTPTDGGTSTDGGTKTDGGTTTDGGTKTDGGTTTDGGTKTDGGTTTDGGTKTDAGP